MLFSCALPALMLSSVAWVIIFVALVCCTKTLFNALCSFSNAFTSAFCAMYSFVCCFPASVNSFNFVLDCVNKSFTSCNAETVGVVSILNISVSAILIKFYKFNQCTHVPVRVVTAYLAHIKIAVEVFDINRNSQVKLINVGCV